MFIPRALMHATMHASGKGYFARGYFRFPISSGGSRLTRLIIGWRDKSVIMGADSRRPPLDIKARAGFDAL